MKSVDRVILEIPNDIEFVFTESGRIDINPEFPICKAGYSDMVSTCDFCAVGYISCLQYFNKKGKEIKYKEFAHCDKLGDKDIFKYIPKFYDYTGIDKIVPHIYYIKNIDEIYDGLYDDVLPLVVSTYSPELIRVIKSAAVLMDGSRYEEKINTRENH